MRIYRVFCPLRGNKGNRRNRGFVGLERMTSLPNKRNTYRKSSRNNPLLRLFLLLPLFHLLPKNTYPFLTTSYLHHYALPHVEASRYCREPNKGQNY